MVYGFSNLRYTFLTFSFTKLISVLCSTIVYRAPRTGGPDAQGLSKSIPGPSNFTRLKPDGPVSKIRFVCV